MDVQPALGPRLRPPLAWWVLMVLATAVGGYGLALQDARQMRDAVPGAPWLDELHFAAGGLALLVGPWLFRRDLLARRRALHRQLGWLYVAAVSSSGAAALTMACFASGGAVARWGFGLLAVAWLGSTWAGIVAIRRRRLVVHRACMVTSFALCCAAVTLRLQLPIGVALAGGFAAAYRVIAWSCWVPNLLFAWWWLRRTDLAGRPVTRR